MSMENEKLQNEEAVENAAAPETAVAPTEVFADELSLDEEFSDDLMAEIAEKDQQELNQSLEGFASCFPDWNLRPPKKH